MNRVGRPIRSELLVVLAAELVLLAALHWVGSLVPTVALSEVPTWFRTADPADALVIVARLAALAIGYWLAATTVLYALSHHLGLSPLTRALRWVTLPAIRQVVQGVTAVSLTGATLLGPSALATAPALAQSFLVGQESPEATTPDGSGGTATPAFYAPDAAGWPQAEAPAGFWLPSAGTSNGTGLPVAASTGGEHVVERGDHFWGIAEQQLEQWRDREATDAEVAGYWVRVVDANRDTIRSGDPDLIFPGERVELPPLNTD